MPLKSAIALHTPLMKAASEQFAVALNDVVFNDPKTWTASVYSGVTGARYQRQRSPDEHSLNLSFKFDPFIGSIQLKLPV